VPALDHAIMRAARPYTMTSPERLAALVAAVRYVVRSGVPGDVAECGVWRGGSMMAVALALLAEGDTSRHLYLYDTFAGMPEPTDADRDYEGVSAEAQLEQPREGMDVWCRASLEDVTANLASTGYPRDRLHFVRGRVEETIPGTAPASLALLRLDTDWYESTRHELEHLYPRLSRKGILILDDYGHWQGARKAVDEYFAPAHRLAFLHRIDYTGRLVLKTDPG
jgi:hypothetical protein